MHPGLRAGFRVLGLLKLGIRVLGGVPRAILQEVFFFLGFGGFRGA